MAISKLRVEADFSDVARKARILARHLAALADKLEQPDGIIKFHGNITAKQAAEFAARFKATRTDQPQGGGEPHDTARDPRGREHHHPPHHWTLSPSGN